MAEVGFDVNAIEVSWPHRSTALHRAAEEGDLAMVTVLVELGADLTVTDATFNGTPRGWAEHLGHAEVAEYLALAEVDRPDDVMR
jgi:ankyrin repeat protein